jgi:hypothetical protein
MSDYAVTTRYPGDVNPVSHEAADVAVRAAGRVRDAGREQLPREVLGDLP